MKALVYAGPMELRFEDVPEPRPAEGEVLIRVAAAGVCGSEVEGVATQSPMRKPPLIMGHEFAGHRVDSGELVTVNPLIHCGQCDPCRAGRTNICLNRVILGIHRPGGFAALVAVPVANCHPLPDGVSALTGAFIEPLANAVHAVALVRAPIAAAQRIGIIGGGALGMAVLLALRAGGDAHDLAALPGPVAGGNGGLRWLPGVDDRRDIGEGPVRIQIADTSPGRRAMAARAGGAEVTDGLDGVFDVIFDTVGTAATRAHSVASLHPGGTAVWLGLHESRSDVDCQAMIRHEKFVLGSFCYTGADFAAAIPLAAHVDEDWLELRALGEGAEVFHRLMGGPSRFVKTLLVP